MTISVGEMLMSLGYAAAMSTPTAFAISSATARLTPPWTSTDLGRALRGEKLERERHVDAGLDELQILHVSTDSGSDAATLEPLHEVRELGVVGLWGVTCMES